MNIVPRCLALILGESSYACFDMDMLRWAAAWTGDFVPMETIGQVSYQDFFSRNRRLPTLSSRPDLVTGLYPGWSGAEDRFVDPRPESAHPNDPPWGPMPQELGRWNGLYRTTDGVVLSYEVSGADILEYPGSMESDGVTLFTRRFRIERLDSDLRLNAAELVDGDVVRADADLVVVAHADGSESFYSLTGSDSSPAGSEGIRLEVKEGRYITVRVPASDGEDVEFMIRSGRGEAGDAERFDGSISGSGLPDFPQYDQGGPALWDETVWTRGQVAPDTSAYVVDELTLPLLNPWNRNVRVVDVAFFDDNRAALVTFEGDVWIVEGIDRELSGLRWHRYASGLYEPQSIAIVDDQIYIYGKEGIVRPVDLNGDGEADFYENFSNLMAQSIESREWASSLVVQPEGGFFITKGSALDAGPSALSGPVTRGIRAGSNHSGTIMEISADGRSAGIYASGLRGPYLGIHPGTGVLTASDQEGNHVPASPLMVVSRGDYYGVDATAHRKPIPENTPPLLCIPHNGHRSDDRQT